MVFQGICPKCNLRPRTICHLRLRIIPLLAWVVIAKYLDHLPLYRQEQMLARWGAAIPRSTLCDWIRIAADWMEPIYKTMLRRLLEGDYLQADETPIKCQDPDNAKAGVFQGYRWVVSRPGDDVCFDWRTSRRHGELTSLIEGFGGVLQSDGIRSVCGLRARTPRGRVGRLLGARAAQVYRGAGREPEGVARRPEADRTALPAGVRMGRCRYAGEARARCRGACAGCTRWR